MAFNAQGTTVTWAGVALGELVSVSVDGIECDLVEVTPKAQTSRFKVYRPADVDQGTVSITMRGTAAATSTCVGTTGALSVVGSGVAWSASVAVYQRLAWRANVGELQEYSVTFKVSG